MTIAPDPRVILIADGFTNDDVARKTIEAVEAGIRWVQLRDHQAKLDDFADAAIRLVDRIREAAPGTRISINRRLDVADSLNVFFHTGHSGPAIRDARLKFSKPVIPGQLRMAGPGEARCDGGRGVIIGYSSHSVQEALEAVKEGADYLFFSPVFPTSSKPGHPGTGLEALALCCKAVAPVPVYALGGITPDRVNACMNNGAQGVAVLSGILKSDAISESVAAYTVRRPGGTSP